MKELGIYLKRLLAIMISKNWLLWEITSGVIALVIWLVPNGIARMISQNDQIIWVTANNKWIALGLWGFITVFISPYLSWRSEYLSNNNLIIKNSKIQEQIDALLPDVVISKLDTKVRCRYEDFGLVCTAEGTIINNSMTGSGTINSLVLGFVINDKTYNVPYHPKTDEGELIGFRIEHNGMFKENIFEFIQYGLNKDAQIEGLSAEIKLEVIGQKPKIYKVELTTKHALHK